ncbi:MAG: response regulator [Syntrophales bacterium]|jgi:two-component system chemotaxis response regulator CheY|nr:response regulator [Syntrophales bacterium]NLN60779.1 response regulator [Deltaproteobacteria bacterium]
MSFNVLIVDDSNAMRSVIRKVIQLSGFRLDNCYEAGNGKQALNVLSREWVDVILSDIHMPEMDGMELLKQIHHHDVFRTIPVIMISTEGSLERVNEAYALGARGFIKKPFLPEELKRTLHEVIGVGDEGEYQGDIDEGDF